MKVIFNKDSDILKLNLQEKSFEWVYFEVDFINNNKSYNFVLIAANGLFVDPDFYENNTKPLLNISFSENKTVKNFVYAKSSKIKYSNNVLTIDKTQIYYKDDGKRIIEFYAVDNNHNVIQGNLEFSPSKLINSADMKFADEEDSLEWGISSLSYKVDGIINISGRNLKVLTTTGYHDYNYGCSDYLYNHVNNWMWLRTQNPNFSMAGFFLDEKKKGNILLIESQNHFQIMINTTVLITKNGLTPFYLKYPKIFQIDNILGITTKSIDYFISILGIKFSGLYYTRRRCEFNLDNIKYFGTIEVFNPKRINNRFIRYAFKQGINKDKRNFFSKFIMK